MSSLRTCISGGSAMPVEVMKNFEKTFDCIVLEGYGLSETSPVASFNQPDIERKPGSIGVPVRGVEMKLVDDDGKDVEEGEVGEIAIKGENVMKGYWGRDEDTEEAIPDGWFRSGDMAKQDEDGYFFIVDRKKDLIIRGGYNVYPREVEEALYEHEAVAEVAVIGIQDDDLGEEVGAAVALKDGDDVDEEELQAFAKERLAAYKYPRAVWIVDELPKGPTGKILRREVSAPEEAEQVSAATKAEEAESASTTRTRTATAAACSASAARPAAQRRRPQPAAAVPAGMSGVRFTANLARRPRTRRRARTSGSPPSWPRSASGAPSSSRTRRTGASPTRPGPRTRCSSAPCRATSPSARPRADWWRTPSSTGATTSGWASSSTTSSRRPPRATTRSSTPRCSSGSLDTGGGNLVEGGRRFVRDFASAPRVPSMVEPDAFEVGTDIAVTPGRRGAAHRRLRADPVHPADPQGRARSRC